MTNMDKLESSGPESIKNKLTEEQKEEIRAEMLKCATPEQARDLRKIMAEYFGVTISQIAAITAYKRNADGSLGLRPQFSKALSRSSTGEHLSPVSVLENEASFAFNARESTTQIEAKYDNPTKGAWRLKVREAIQDNFSKNELRKARVVCLPGQALQEVTQVYMPLGIQPENIVCIERDHVVADRMRAAARQESLAVTIFEGTVEEFLQSPHKPVTIASFDFLGQVHASFLGFLPYLRTADKYMLITNFLARREQKGQQLDLKTNMILGRAIGTLPSITTLDHPSRLRELSDSITESFHESNADLVAGKKDVDLSTARDEGLITTLFNAVAAGHNLAAYEELYRERGATPPRRSQESIIKFVSCVPDDLWEIIEQAFAPYQQLSKRLSPLREVANDGALRRYSHSGKNGFMLSFSMIASYCYGGRVPCDIRRYEYASEDAGSPYQTDAITELYLGPSFQQVNPKAYNFIRDCFRILGLVDKSVVVIELEKFGAPLSKNYSGNTVGISLLLKAKGKLLSRVKLRDIQQLVDAFPKLAYPHFRSEFKDFLNKPRVKITAP